MSRPGRGAGLAGTVGIAGFRAETRSRSVDVLRELMAPGTPVALVDFPRYANVGDSAIWLGERALLRELGVELRYVCDLRTYSAQVLAARLPRGTILLRGGGNLGDLWPHHQYLRERVISDFPGHRIIQLPQSVHFQDGANLDRARTVFDAHPDLTLLLRDHRSRRTAREAFRAPALLCPDSVFALPASPAPARPYRHILWLSRTDHEAASHTERVPDDAVHRTDWTAQEGSEPGWATRLRAAERAVEDAARQLREDGTDHCVAALTDAYDRHAELQLSRGCRLLSSARVVITDRLHAHLLCLLLEVPHVVLDDRNGKVSGYRETWELGHRRPAAFAAASPGQALRMAERMAGGHG